MKINIGIICPSEIALRRFMPALMQCEDFAFSGVAVAANDEWFGQYTDEMRKSELSKAEAFVNEYGGKVYGSYNELISDNSIDAVYLPLPPALHFRWGREVLKHGKHLFVEKPGTVSLNETSELVDTAAGKGLAVHENYMFRFHSQLDYIQNMIAEGKIGEIRSFRISFGFPRRSKDDFRYVKKLGGGALLDCGGYTIKLADILLDEAEIVTSQLNYISGCEVDMFGSATMRDKNGTISQLLFGMDNSYKCDLEAWGSEGCIFTNRIMTAPVGFEPSVFYKKGNENTEEIKLASDDTFKKSLMYFKNCIDDENVRKDSYKQILRQARLVEKVIRNEG